MGVRRIRKIRIGMNYTIKTKVIASEFVIKCIMAVVFILFLSFSYNLHVSTDWISDIRQESFVGYFWEGGTNNNRTRIDY